MSTNYKESLNLPKTDFPMKADLVKREPERLAQWEAADLYGQIQAARKEAELFVLHDGPPFANGDVHMGTALNKILKDLIVKSKTMAGFRAPFVPGWDCHGLPIEFKVVKESRGLSPLAIRQKSEAYARKFIDIQRGQFKRLGVLGDWAHPYLTLEPSYEAEEIRAFATFVEKGLVYQSMKPVYWSTGAQTALAEAEVEYADREDPAIFVKFPLVTGELAGQASMVIWTTTPWTLPANVAIAVSPKHEYVVGEFTKLEDVPERSIQHFVIARALLEVFQEATGFVLKKEFSALLGSALAGSEAQHPFLERTAKIIEADFVTMDTGTGQVHIAPGHGSDDYLAGVQNGLPILSPVDEHGRFTEEVGVPVWQGKYVFDANKEVVEYLRENGTLIGEQVYKHSYPHCWRSKTPVVFRAVEQFFINIDKVRAQALAAIDSVAWIPHWGRNRIFGTVESRPDWCISRQRSWGVPLPVFYDADKKPIIDPVLVRKVADIFDQHGTNYWFEKNDAEWAELLGLPKETTRRNDTLDVWLDSGVSHEAVVAKRPELGGPGREADIYLEATDQHRGWFQSSLMTSVAMNGRAPYKTVITHGFVVDKDGKKISKSSSYQKPMDAAHFVNKYGADIVRLWVSSVDYQNEVPFSEESFTRLGEAYRSFRNILRILLANAAIGRRSGILPDSADGLPVCPESQAGSPLAESGWKPDLRPTTIDRWMLSKLQGVISICREAYAAYDFRKVFQTLNQFVTVDVSALYVDITKDRMYCDALTAPRRQATQAVMATVADALCRLLAPILAYTADEAWEFLGNKTSVHLEKLPEAEQSLIDKALEDRISALLELRAVIAQAIEPARQAKQIGNALEASVTLQTPGESAASGMDQTELEEFFILSELKWVAGPETKASVELVSHQKCARCWRHRSTVGASETHPELCERCLEVEENV